MTATSTSNANTYPPPPPPKKNLGKHPGYLSSSELHEHRDKGVYYTCDEEFVPGFKRKSRFFLLVL